MPCIKVYSVYIRFSVRADTPNMFQVVCMMEVKFIVFLFLGPF